MRAVHDKVEGGREKERGEGEGDSARRRPHRVAQRYLFILPRRMDIERTRLRAILNAILNAGTYLHAMRKARILLVVMNNDGYPIPPPVVKTRVWPATAIRRFFRTRNPPRVIREITNPGFAKLRRMAIAPRLIYRV